MCVGVDAKKIGDGGVGKVCRQGSGNVGFYPGGRTFEEVQEKKKYRHAR